MGQDPDAIRREIEETRERMGETVGAIGYKADVPSRAKEAVSGRVTSVKESITGSTPSTGEVKDVAKRGAGIAQENPLGLAVGSIAIGFLAGMLIPTTRVENEKLGPVADQVKDQVKETGQEALDRGKQVAQEVASTAQEHVQEAAQDVKQTAQESAQQQGEELKSSAQDSAQQVRSTTTS
jgi:gas vesicle protein